MKRILFIVVLLLIGGFARSQEITLYQMYAAVPQANQVNPVFAPKAKVTVGLPLLSSNYIRLNAPLSWDDIFNKGADDSLRIDSQKIIDSFEKNDGKLDFRGNIGLLYFGLETKHGFFTLNFNSRVDLGFTMPGNIIQFILGGEDNPNEPSIIKINETNFRASWFNELALGYRRDINDKLTVAGKFKYLQGIANVSVEGLNGQFESGIDSINITMDPWTVNTAGIDSTGLVAFNDGVNQDYFLFKNQNTGWAIDLGAEYRLTDEILLSASVLDLGKITWKDETKSYLFDGVNYTFDGLDVLELLDGDSQNDGNNVLEDELDSLKTLFDPEEVEGTVYSTPLTGKFYLGGTYTLMRMHTFGLIIYGEVFKSRLTPAFGLTYNIQVGKILNAGINTTYRNNSFINFGLALSTKLGPVNLYGIVGNFQSILIPNNARTISARVGLNLMFGESNRR